MSPWWQRCVHKWGTSLHYVIVLQTSSGWSQMGRWHGNKNCWRQVVVYLEQNVPTLTAVCIISHYRRAIVIYVHYKHRHTTLHYTCITIETLGHLAGHIHEMMGWISIWRPAQHEVWPLPEGISGCGQRSLWRGHLPTFQTTSLSLVHVIPDRATWQQNGG